MADTKIKCLQNKNLCYNVFMKKRMCIFWGKEIKRSWVFKVFVYGLVVGSLFVGKALSTVSVLALSYSQAVDVSFEFNPTLSISLSSADLLIPELAPGNVSDSNIITVGVSTNTAYGYTLTANVGNNSSYNTRNLIRGDENTDTFTSVATDASLGSLSADNTWGFSYLPSGSGSSWADYSGLPLYSDTQNTKTLVETSSALDPQSVQFKIAAKAASTMTAGEYRNVINFIAVAKPEPTPAPIACGANTICYSINALDNAEGVMANQGSASANANVTLRASNYSRSGFGFAGWNTAPDYSGTTYGPNQTIQAPADMSHGLALYAVWVPSKGVLQDWTGCVGLNIGDVTALTDARDNDTYAVAKLADGRCWMIENLRIDGEDTRSESQKNLAQGYGGHFAGLADAEAPWVSVTTADNSLYYSGTQAEGSTAIIDIGTNNYPAIRFPRYNNYNTANRVGSMESTNANVYSYGNYYTWAAAIASDAVVSDSSPGVTATAICPKGWRLPTGSNVNYSYRNEYWGLIVDGLNNGVAPTNYDTNDTGRLYPYYSSGTDGQTISNELRSYPNNFINSGILYNGSINNRGVRAYYWTSTPGVPGCAYVLEMNSNGAMLPGTRSDVKRGGYAVRCIMDNS